MNNLLDLREWLQWADMAACRYPSNWPEGSVDFIREALENEEQDCTPEYWELAGEIHKATDQKFAEDEPEKGLEFLIERGQMLDDIEATLQKTEFDGVPIKGAADEAIGILLDRIKELEAELAALKAPAVVLSDGTALEFDL